MAEPTEQEQLKTNQHLTKIENAASETSGKIDELISAVKQPATYETDLLKEIKDQGEEQAQTDKKTLKSQKAFHEDVKELTKNSATEKDHNKFMEVMEKKKVGLQEIALKDNSSYLFLIPFSTYLISSTLLIYFWAIVRAIGLTLNLLTAW